ncbi:MAG: amidohydrolase family protein [Gammaproteobacteria bacterium]|nr:amidohydrolase family protein [Gammaproteobacteria bacterium]
MHDLLFVNATVVDGTGAPARRASLAVRDGRISAIVDGADADPGPARVRIDADGRVLAPGIIDPHTHYDAQITWDPSASPSLGLGVTTVIMGNCGFTIAPCKPGDRDRTLKNLTQVEGMSLDALQAGTRWDFETFPQYLQMLRRNGVAPNVATYCGHSSLRTYVMGEAATERAATADEIAQMRGLLIEALDNGAIGFATSTFEGHNGWGGVPMPSRLADAEELDALIGALGETGKGCFMLTKGRNDRIDRFEQLAARTGRPMVVAAIAYDKANPQAAIGDIRAIEAAAERGQPVYAQVPCTPISMDLTLTGFYAFEGLASWKPAIGLYHDKPKLAALYADPAFRAAVKQELVAPGALNRFTDQWHLMEILEPARAEHRHYTHRNIAELAEVDGKHPLDWLLDFGASEDFDTLFNAQILNADETEVLKLLKSPRTSITLSDAGAHLSLFCDAGFALHMLSRWVRERGDFTLEEAVHRLTGAQADIYGIPDRGRLRVGAAADLILFDAQTVGRTPKQRTRDLPAGAARLVTGSTGLHGVWVNGVRTVEDDRLVVGNATPGEVLERFAS